MPSWSDNGANLPDREAAIRAELTASNGGATISGVLINGNDGGGKGIQNIADPINPGDVATKRYVDSQDTLYNVLQGGNDAQGSVISNIGAPINGSDAATKSYVDTAASAAHSLSAVLAAGNDAGAVTITNLPVPSASSQAATKGYVDTTFAGATTPSLNSVLGVGADAGGHTVTNAGDPSSATDLATKDYVDGATFNNQAASYTLVMSDRGKTINFTASTAVTLTVPPNSSVAFPTSPRVTQIIVCQGGTGQVTIAGGTGVTIVNPFNSFTTSARYAEVKLTKIGTDTWRLNGEVT